MRCGRDADHVGGPGASVYDLPDHVDAVPSEDAIARHDRIPLDACLRDNQPIERIAVMEGQELNFRGLLPRHGDRKSVV